MTSSELLLVVIVLQQALFGLMWLISARLRLARLASWHWAATAGLLVAGLSLVLLRGQAPAWLAVGGANLCILGAFVALRRGVQRFARQPPTDREASVLLALSAASLPFIAVKGDWVPFAVLLQIVAIVWTMGNSANDIRRFFAEEFGRRAALGAAMPLGAVAVLFTLRAALAPIVPGVYANYMQRPGGDSGVAVFIGLVFSLLLQLNLCALVMLRLVRRLQHQSDHDALTGLLSRRPLEERLHAEVLRCARHGGSFALLSVDIDHFKQINDRFGHAAGDAVLVRVAHALRDTARRVDSVARMGGEEFCLLLPDTGRGGADELARRLLDAVRTLCHPEADPALRVTVSIGLAIRESEAEPLSALQRRLDQALYAAKSAGRDRVQPALAATA